MLYVYKTITKQVLVQRVGDLLTREPFLLIQCSYWFCAAVQPVHLKKKKRRRKRSDSKEPFVHESDIATGLGVRGAGVSINCLSLHMPCLSSELWDSRKHHSKKCNRLEIKQSNSLVQQLVNVVFHKPPSMDDYHLFCASCRKTGKKQTTVRESDNDMTEIALFLWV